MPPERETSSQKETFFQRHKKEIMLLLITSIIGLGIMGFQLIIEDSLDEKSPNDPAEGIELKFLKFLENEDVTGFNLLNDDWHTEVELSSVDLSNKNLRGIDLQGFVFKTSDFSHADLTNANLNGVRIEDSDLSYTDLTNAKIKGGMLFENIFIHTNLSRADLTDIQLYGEIDGTIFKDADLTTAQLGSNSILNADFTNAYLYNTHLIGVYIKNSDFSFAHIETNEFFDMQIIDSKFDGVTMKNVDMRFSWIENSTFKNADLQNTYFDETQLNDVDFYQSDLRGSSFYNSDLMRVNFSETNLNDMSFLDTNLGFVNFKNSIRDDTLFNNNFSCDAILITDGQCMYGTEDNPEYYYDNEFEGFENLGTDYSTIDDYYSDLVCNQEAGMIRMSGTFTNDHLPTPAVMLLLFVLDENYETVSSGEETLYNLDPNEIKYFEIATVYDGPYASCEMDLVFR